MLHRFLAACLLALTASCTTYTPSDRLSGGVPESTLLALSPDGQQVLVAMHQSRGHMKGRLIELPGKVATDFALPRGTIALVWAHAPDEVLLTTLTPDGGRLIRLNVKTGAQRVLYESASVLRFPLQTGDETYVFLEARQPGDRYSLWQRLSAGRKSLLNERTYGAAAPMQQVQGSLHLLEPTKEFRQFEGTLPSGLRELVTRSTWYLYCADASPLRCVRTHLVVGPTGEYIGSMDVVHGDKRCKVGERWVDERQVTLSQDGRTAVFHSGPERGSKRSVYLVKLDGDCTPSIVYSP